MTAVVQVPVEERLPVVAGSGQVLLGRGWQRAIAQAQGAGWFQGALSTRPGTAMVAGSSLPAPPPALLRAAVVEERTPVKGPPVAQVVAGASRAAGPGPTTSPTRPGGAWSTAPMPSEAPRALADLGPEPLVASVHIDGRDAEAAAVDGVQRVRAAPRQVAGPAANPPSLHVHVEAHGDGLHVWLGIPASATGVLPEMRAMQRALPGRLAALVCNGMPVPVGPAVARPLYPPGLAGHNQEP